MAITIIPSTGNMLPQGSVYAVSPAASSGVAGLTLLTSADETGASVDVLASGRYNWLAWGTWDGATAQLQFSPDAGTTWIDIDGVSLTANGGWTEVPIAGGNVRVSISGAGGSTSLNSKFGGIS